MKKKRLHKELTGKSWISPSHLKVIDLISVMKQKKILTCLIKIFCVVFGQKQGALLLLDEEINKI